MNQTEVMKNKMLRGQVLRTLTLFYPSPVDVSGIKSALLTRGLLITADITKVLYYLKDKQYINISKSTITEIEDSDLVELTAKGVDLIEGTIDDPGVEI
jgi:hypothetical protein